MVLVFFCGSICFISYSLYVYRLYAKGFSGYFLFCSADNQIRTAGLGTAMEVLTRLDLDLAYSAEKLVNLEILLMQMSAWENDCELVILENTCISEESCEKALVYDLLSGILDSEVRELDYFINTRKLDILNANKNLSPSQHFEEFFTVSVEEKLHDSEECLKQLKQKVLDMKLHSEELQGRLSSIGRTGMSIKKWKYRIQGVNVSFLNTEKMSYMELISF